MTEPTKVAVLGGGVGGMTAAFELTATPELRAALAALIDMTNRAADSGVFGARATLGFARSADWRSEADRILQQVKKD